MGTRKAWKDLTPAYKARLERAGDTQRTHAVKNLTRARGHRPSRPAGSIEPEYIERLLASPPKYQELKDLAKKFTRPAWIPEWVSVDAAAALSQLPNPKRWDAVDFTPRPDGEPWTMRVRLKGNAYDREILIPGGGGPGSGAKEILQLVSELMGGPTTKRLTNKKQAAIDALFMEVRGSDDTAPEVALKVGRRGVPGAVWHRTTDLDVADCNKSIVLDLVLDEDQLGPEELRTHPKCKRCFG